MDCAICKDPFRIEVSLPVRSQYCNHVFCQNCLTTWHKRVIDSLPESDEIFDSEQLSISDEDGTGGCPMCRCGASRTEEKYEARNGTLMHCRQISKIEIGCVGHCGQHLSRNVNLLFPCGHVACNSCDGSRDLVGKECPTCGVTVQKLISDHYIEPEIQKVHFDDFEERLQHFTDHLNDINPNDYPLEFLRSRISFYNTFQDSNKAFIYFLEYEKHQFDRYTTNDKYYHYKKNSWSKVQKVYWNILMELILPICIHNPYEISRLSNVFIIFNIPDRLKSELMSLHVNIKNIIDVRKDHGFSHPYYRTINISDKLESVPKLCSSQEGWRLEKTDLDSSIPWLTFPFDESEEEEDEDEFKIKMVKDLLHIMKDKDSECSRIYCARDVLQSIFRGTQNVFDT